MIYVKTTKCKSFIFALKIGSKCYVNENKTARSLGISKFIQAFSPVTSHLGICALFLWHSLGFQRQFLRICPKQYPLKPVAHLSSPGPGLVSTFHRNNPLMLLLCLFLFFSNSHAKCLLALRKDRLPPHWPSQLLFLKSLGLSYSSSDSDSIAFFHSPKIQPVRPHSSTHSWASHQTPV